MAAFVKFNTVMCVKPDEVIRDFLSRRKDGASPNCYVSSWGEKAGYGWILLTRSDVDALDLSSAVNSLTFHDDSGEVRVGELLVTYVESLYGLYFNKPTDICLVKVEDGRAISHLTTVDKHYNMVRRSWLSDTNKRFVTLSDEISDGTAIVEDLWDELPAGLFGTAITQDISSAYEEIEYPENLDYQQTNAWNAVCDAAHRVGLEVTISHDFETILFQPHNLDTTNPTTVIESLSDYLMASTSTTFPIPTRYPETYRVLFRKAFTDVVGNTTDTRVLTADEDRTFDPYYAKDILTSSVITVTTFTDTIQVLYHDRVIVDREYTAATYDALALKLVENHVEYLQRAEKQKVTYFSGFHEIPFQAFNQVQYLLDETGPYTITRLDPVVIKPDLSEDRSGKITFGFGMVTTASTKYNRDTTAVSTNGRLKPVQRDGDNTLDDGSTKELEFISFSDYPIGVGQIVQYVMDTNSMRCVAVPMGLQTTKPLFVEFEIDTTLTGALNATITQQFWGPTLAGSDLEIEVTSSNDDLGSPQYDLTQEGYIGLAFLQEDGKYRCFDLQCGT